LIDVQMVGGFNAVWQDEFVKKIAQNVDNALKM
jgi:hypothetical protein